MKLKKLAKLPLGSRIPFANPKPQGTLSPADGQSSTLLSAL